MFERMRSRDPDERDERILERTDDREVVERRTVGSSAAETGDTAPGRGRAGAEGAAGAASSRPVRADEFRARQREQFGGFHFGPAFFGWLVAVGVGVLLTALLSAAGAAVGLTQLSPQEAQSQAAGNPTEIGIASAIALLVVLFISYFAGGYVAGRMARFSGAKHGVGVWVIALLATALLAVLGAVAGDEYNILARLNQPAIPVGTQELAGGALLALLAIVVVTLLAAILGGILGVRFHKKVDRAGFAA